MGNNNSNNNSNKHAERSGWRKSVPDYFTLIPAELAYHILSYFDYQTLLRVAMVNRLLYILASDDRLWKEIYQKDFGNKFLTFFSDTKFSSWRSVFKETIFIHKRLNQDSNGTGGPQVVPRVQKQIKLVVIGDNMLGQKTALLLAYFHNCSPAMYYKGYIPAVFENNVVSLIVVTDFCTYEVQLSLWDTSGHEEFEKLRPLQYANTNVFLLCYSIVQPESFGSVRSRWWPEIKSACPDVPVLLVALQKELRNHPKTLKALKAKMQRPITSEEGIMLARDLQVPYYECSSESGDGLKSVFRAAVKTVLFPQNAHSTNSKSFMFPLKNNKPKKDTVLFMSSGEPFKGKKIREEDAKGADADSQWELCYTEAGDQYWQNKYTSENAFSEQHSHSRKHEDDIVVSQPFNVAKITSSENLSEFINNIESTRNQRDIYISETSQPTNMPPNHSPPPSPSKSKDKNKLSRSNSDLNISLPTSFRHVSVAASHMINSLSSTLSSNISNIAAISNTNNNDEKKYPQNVRYKSMVSKEKENRDNNKKKIFGISLQQWYSTWKVAVPDVVVQAVLILLEKGVNVPGIFRVSGNVSVINSIKEKYDKGETVNLNEIEVHTVTGVLRKWLNDLPEPLIPPLIKQDFYSTLHIQNEEERNGKIYLLLKSLPVPNRETLRLLLCLLNKIHTNSALTEMNAHNLSLILRAPIIGFDDEAATLLEIFITNYSIFFEGMALKLNASYQHEELQQVKLRKEEEEGRIGSHDNTHTTLNVHNIHMKTPRKLTRNNKTASAHEEVTVSRPFNVNIRTFNPKRNSLPLDLDTIKALNIPMNIPMGHPQPITPSSSSESSDDNSSTLNSRSLGSEIIAKESKKKKKFKKKEKDVVVSAPFNLKHEATLQVRHRSSSLSDSEKSRNSRSGSPSAALFLSQTSFASGTSDKSVPRSSTERKRSKTDIRKGEISVESSKTEKKKKKEKKEKSEKKSHSPEYALLVRIGSEEDFPTKVNIKARSVASLRTKLLKKFKLNDTATVLYYDDDFQEYCRLPDSDKLPLKAKLLIINH